MGDREGGTPVPFNRPAADGGPSDAGTPDAIDAGCPTCSVNIAEQPRCCVLVPPAGRPATSITLHATGNAPGGTYVWAAADPNVVQVTGSGSTATVVGRQAGVTDITVTYTCTNGLNSTARVRCIAFTATISHPSGNPVNAGSATNEFTYNAATPGVLSIECRAQITPNTPEAIACADPHLRWTIDAVGASTLAWNRPAPGGAAQGMGATATATFTGLPAHNADFGAKSVTLLLDGGGPIASTTVEIFFPKTSTNHPNPGQGTTPNWFFYWSQVIGSPAHLRYAGAGRASLFGETRAMTQWSYAAVPNKTIVHIRDAAAGRDGAIPGLHGPLTGIDLFKNTVLHETEHTQQIARADPVVGIHAATCWQFGWSWNVAGHNHWSVGPDGQPGRAGVDDDHDGTVDNQITTGRGEMGAAGSDDVKLEAANPASVHLPTSDWPTAWGPIPAGAGPAGSYIGGDHIEQQAFQSETSPEHALARQDWSDPGKNHRTLDNFND